MRGIRTKSGLAAVLAVGAALLGSAVPASAAKQRLQTGIFDDSDAKLSIVIKTSKSGKPSKISSLKATNYDVRCQTVGQPETELMFEVDFAFPAIDVKRERSGKFSYSFSEVANTNDPFSEGFYSHGGLAEGWFTSGKSGKPTKLVGYLSMGGLSNSVPGVPPPGTCADPVRDHPFAKQHGLFSASLR